MANSCPKASFCRATGCKGVHSSYLHPKSVQPATNQSSPNPTSASVESPEQGSVQDVLNGYVRGNNESRNIEDHSHCQASVTGLTVIPVKVKAPDRANPVMTYAFLDNGSNTSFCSEQLAKQLGLSGNETSLSLTMMEKEKSRTDCLVVSLEVLDIEGEIIVDLPVVFTRPKLPTAKTGIYRNFAKIKNS